MIRTRGRRPLACHHEAGHAVARWWMGFPSDGAVVLTVEEVRTGATILDQDGNKHRCEGLAGGSSIYMPIAKQLLTFMEDDERSWYAKHVEKRITMAIVELYAGSYAEARYLKRSALSCLLAGGTEDARQAQDIASWWFAKEGWWAAQSQGENLARILVRSPKAWAAIQAVAAVLLDRGRVDGDEVDALCSAAYGAPFAYDRWAECWPPTPAQIRTGFLPVREMGRAASRYHVTT